MPHSNLTILLSVTGDPYQFNRITLNYRCSLPIKPYYCQLQVFHTNFRPLEWTVPGREDNMCYGKLICLIQDDVSIVNPIILINVTYNLVLADKMSAINSLLSLNIKENRIQLKEKVRLELERGLTKDHILNKEDKVLLRKFYLKIKKEFENIDN